jgi:hypothetical protein
LERGAARRTADLAASTTIDQNAFSTLSLAKLGERTLIYQRIKGN